MSVGVSVWPGSQIIYVIFGHFIQWQFAQKKQVVELFSRRRWRLVSAQLSNQFGYCPLYTVSIVLLVHKRNSLPLGHIQAFISRKLPCSPNKCTKCYRNFWQMWNKPSKLPDFSKFGKYRKIWSHCRVCVYLKITESEKEEVECPSIFLKQTVRRKKWSGKRRRRRRFLSTLYCNVNVVCLCHFCLSQQDLEKERKRRKKFIPIPPFSLGLIFTFSLIMMMMVAVVVAVCESIFAPTCPTYKCLCVFFQCSSIMLERLCL